MKLLEYALEGVMKLGASLMQLVTALLTCLALLMLFFEPAIAVFSGATIGLLFFIWKHAAPTEPPAKRARWSAIPGTVILCETQEQAKLVSDNFKLGIDVESVWKKYDYCAGKQCCINPNERIFCDRSYYESKGLVVLTVAQMEKAAAFSFRVLVDGWDSRLYLVERTGDGMTLYLSHQGTWSWAKGHFRGALAACSACHEAIKKL